MIPAGSVPEPSLRLLLLLSRVAFTDRERQEAVTLCRSFSDWRLFADLAIRHGVAALAWQNLTDLRLVESVPEPERIILEGIRLKSIARVAYITEVAAEIVTTLDNAGIRVLLLKGLSLEHAVYGSRGLRQMSDADLLVAPEEIFRAREVLASAGFISQPMKSPLYRHIILDLGNHLPEMHRGGMSVDLHHRLFGPKGTELIREAIAGPAVIKTDSRIFNVLPPQTAFLGLVNHIFKHEIKGEFQLRLYADLFLLIEKYRDEIFADSLQLNAESAGIEGEVRVVLTILKHAYSLEIPAAFNAATEPEKERVNGFMEKLLRPDVIIPQSPRSKYFEVIESLPGLRRKLIFIAGDMFPSPGFMKRRYNCQSSAAALLRYPHRLGKAIWIFTLLLSGIRGK
ncbi:MAG: nucleotidyltransferase family protein [Bacteroidales bacterium]|nr:nucleotidyltransferase family protein [Bacteroidales bacterium]